MVSELFWNSIRINFGQLENINAVHWRLDQPKFRNISSQNANPTLEADLSQRSQEPIKKPRPINVEKFEMRKKSAKNVVPENSQCPHRALKTYAILSLKSAPKTSQNGEKKWMHSSNNVKEISDDKNFSRITSMKTPNRWGRIPWNNQADSLKHSNEKPSRGFAFPRFIIPVSFPRLIFLYQDPPGDPWLAVFTLKKLLPTLLQTKLEIGSDLSWFNCVKIRWKLIANCGKE